MLLSLSEEQMSAEVKQFLELIIILKIFCNVVHQSRQKKRDVHHHGDGCATHDCMDDERPSHPLVQLQSLKINALSKPLSFSIAINTYMKYSHKNKADPIIIWESQCTTEEKHS